MSLKCTVFGHRFAEAETERTREEEGSEVVITVQEIESCVRCGHRRIVSENKEVTTLEPDEPRAEPDDRAATGAPEQSPQPTPDADAESAEILDDDPAERLVQEAEPDASGPGDAGAGPSSGEAGHDAGGDDGVILEESREREPGAWPEEPEDDGPDWEPPTDLGGTEPDVEATGEAVTVPEGSFHCPECGFTTPVESSSLREGDFCPECHTGSLAHRTNPE